MRTIESICLATILMMSSITTFNVFATDTTTNDPTNTVSPNEFTNPNNAFTSNNVYATGTNNQEQGYKNFGFAIPNDTTIDNIKVTLEGNSGACAKNTKRFTVTLSKDNGGSFNGGNKDYDVTAQDTTNTQSFSSNGWNTAQANNIGLKVKAICSGGNDNAGLINLDHIAIQIQFTIHHQTITIHKTVVLDAHNNGQLDLNLVHVFIDNVEVSLDTQINVSSGVHTITETTINGYTKSISNDCNNQGIVNVQQDTNKNCTVTNTVTDSDNDGWGNLFDNCPNDSNANQLDDDNDGIGNACDNNGNVTVIKLALPNNTDQVFHFTGDLGEFDLSNNDQMVFNQLEVGEYNIIEQLPNGWIATEIVCFDTGNDNSFGNIQTSTITIIIDDGETIECTITNSQQQVPTELLQLNLTGCDNPQICYLSDTVTTNMDQVDNLPSGFRALDNMVSFHANVALGDTITITITYNNDIPTNTLFYKLQNNVWYDYTANIGSNDGDNIITITLTDGGIGDSDGIVNGIIDDPIIPVIPIETGHGCSTQAIVNDSFIKQNPDRDFRRCVVIDNQSPQIVKVYTIKNWFCIDAIDNVGISKVILTNNQLTVEVPKWQGSSNTFCIQNSPIHEDGTTVAIDLAGNTSKAQTSIPSLFNIPNTHAIVSSELNPHKNIEGIWILKTDLKQIRIVKSPELGNALMIDNESIQSLNSVTLITMKWLGMHSTDYKGYETHGWIYLMSTNNGIVAKFNVDVTDDIHLTPYNTNNDLYNYNIIQIQQSTPLTTDQISRILDISKNDFKYYLPSIE